MIRKQLHILLIMLLLVSTSGISINMHFSNHKLFSTAIFGKAESCCKTLCDCCTEKEDVYKIHTNYTISSFTVDLQSPLDYFSFFINALFLCEQENIFFARIEKSPPPSDNLNFQITNQVFIL